VTAATELAAAPSPDAPILEVADLTVTYHSHGALLRAVDSVSLALLGGETVGLVGESGCGKTTVAKSIAGLHRPDAGRISLEGAELSSRRTRSERRAIQMVFQDPYSSLNPRLSVRSALAELLTVHGLARGPAVEARCRELIGLVGLSTAALDSYPSAFSGGQRQRIAIARALSVEPRILIADEPTSALDVSVQAAILSLFGELQARLGITILLISHNLAAVRQLCRRVAVMYLGRIVEIGRSDAVFSDARHPYTQALLAAAPRILSRPGTARPRLRGEPPSATAIPTGCPFHPRCPRAESLCAVDRPELAPARGSTVRAACHFRDESHRAELGA
jgi:oligopeptide/dipeptide ABC transporter ATP-binding protein